VTLVAGLFHEQIPFAQRLKSLTTQGAAMRSRMALKGRNDTLPL
jgi:hypothetical protein